MSAPTVVYTVKSSNGASSWTVRVRGGRFVCQCSRARCSHVSAVKLLLKGGKNAAIVRDGQDVSLVRVNLTEMAEAIARSVGASLSLEASNAVALVKRYRRPSKPDPIVRAARDAAKRITLGERAERVIEEVVRRFAGTVPGSDLMVRTEAGIDMRGVRTIILEE